MYVSQADFCYHRLIGKGETFQKCAQLLRAKSGSTYRPKALERVNCKNSAIHSLDPLEPERDQGHCRAAQRFKHLLLAHTQALSQGFSSLTPPCSGILIP